MAGAAATMAGSALLFVGAISAMTAVSHCPRYIRVWPAMLIASCALVMSDRSMVLIGELAPLGSVRWLLAVCMLGSAAGTLAAMAHAITTLCPLCRSDTMYRRRSTDWPAGRICDEHEDGLL